MPVTAVAARLAAGSMAGVPLFFGFVAKEQFYDSVRHFGQFGVWPGVVLVAAAVAASALLGAAGLMAGVSPFVGRADGADWTAMKRRRRCGWDPSCSAAWGWSSASCRRSSRLLCRLAAAAVDAATRHQ